LLRLCNHRLFADLHFPADGHQLCCLPPPSVTCAAGPTRQQHSDTTSIPVCFFGKLHLRCPEFRRVADFYAAVELRKMYVVVGVGCHVCEGSDLLPGERSLNPKSCYVAARFCLLVLYLHHVVETIVHGGSFCLIRTHQVLNISSLIPLIVVGWRELLHMLGYSTILMIISIHVCSLHGTSPRPSSSHLFYIMS
jgi:hypothetical protein